MTKEKLKIALLIQNAFLANEYNKEFRSEHSNDYVDKFIEDFKNLFNIYPSEMNYNNEGFPINIKDVGITEDEYIKGCEINSLTIKECTEILKDIKNFMDEPIRCPDELEDIHIDCLKEEIEEQPSNFGYSLNQFNYILKKIFN